MTTVNPANSNSAAAASAALSSATNSSVGNLGINDFITLMTTQLKYQDPSQPQRSDADGLAAGAVFNRIRRATIE